MWEWTISQHHFKAISFEGDVWLHYEGISRAEFAQNIAQPPKFLENILYLMDPPNL